MKAALVLGAGGVSGGFFIRAGLAALTERTGWVPAMSDTVIGTSAGALNAARISADPVPLNRDALRALGELAVELGVPDRSVVDRAVAGPRRAAGRLVGRFAPAGSNAPDYDVAQAPFHPAVSVVSCLRSSGERRVTRLAGAEDPSAELYASAAIPGYSPPVMIDGVEHVDGAVWSTTNADLVAADHDVLIVIAPMVPLSGGSFVRRSHRAVLLDELASWSAPVVLLAPTESALDRSDDHDAFAADARRQIL